MSRPPYRDQKTIAWELISRLEIKHAVLGPLPVWVGLSAGSRLVRRFASRPKGIPPSLNITTLPILVVLIPTRPSYNIPVAEYKEQVASMPDFKGLDLTGKTAIVTGASRGIGAAIAIQLGHRGANVVVNYTSDKSSQCAADVAKKIVEAGSKATLCQASVADVNQISEIVNAALQLSQTGKIEILVHNAALGIDANLDQVTEELFETHFNTNVKGPIFLTKAVIPHIARGGRIVFVSSAAARLGVAGQTIYGATKAANESCARVWAKELGQSHDVTVNCINPGPVATDQWRESDEQFRQDMKPLIEETPAAARIAEVEDIAPLVAFLCTEDARWTTGGVLCANGGLYN